MSGLDVYRTITAFGWDVSWKSDKPVPDDAWPIDIINRAIAAAVQAERAKALKEAAGELCQGCAKDWPLERTHPHNPPVYHRKPEGGLEYCGAREIRALMSAAIEGGDDAGTS